MKRALSWWHIVSTESPGRITAVGVTANMGSRTVGVPQKKCNPVCGNTEKLNNKIIAMNK